MGATPARNSHTLDELTAIWSARWAERGTYTFDRDLVDRDEHTPVYSIDTPPPTVSGSLHVGHVFSYTHADILARYKRMRGFAVFYPMGWDDNGLPTERRVENRFGVRCDPALRYDADFTPGDGARCSRRNFIELCHELTATDERAFEELWRAMGYSVDWSLTYTTIGERARATAQRAFLDQLAAGRVYAAEAPTIWDISNETAVAQAELEDREITGAFHRLRFAGPEGPIEIETTRPELLPACVALVAHPDDERYADLFGGTARTPLFDVEVPILAHRLAEPNKGTGIAMICTFGDITDVVWWRELGLPTRAVTTKDGRITDEAPEGVGGPAWHAITGLSLANALKSIVDLLRENGSLIGEPRPITHSVKFYERGQQPIEIVTSRQWFLRLLDKRADFRCAAGELDWLPPFMRRRLIDWIDGLNSDWLLSRQRFFGVPIPLWYPLNADGTPDHAHPLIPESVPVDPSTDTPPGYTPQQRDVPGGFTGEPDVLDTWATSSLTPQIAARALDDPALFDRVFPMDLRPQSHEIIRTWLFYTLARSLDRHQTLPWRTVLISGWVLDPDRKKMSKSKGNVTTPMHLVQRYGPDALRHWSAAGRPSTDTAFHEAQLKVGRRLAMKVLNAGRFVLSRIGGGDGPVTEPLDVALLAALDELIGRVTESYEAHDYTGALAATETFFWSFCDDYLELVKERAYGDPALPSTASAHAALARALSVLLRLLAPVLPFVTEEVWSWQSSWHSEHSIHLADWPVRSRDTEPGATLDAVYAALAEVRKAKSAAKLSMKTTVTRLVVTDTAERVAALRTAEADLRSAGSIAEVEYREGERFEASVELE